MSAGEVHRERLGDPGRDTAAEEIRIMRPDVRIYGERERDGVPIIGIARNTGAGDGFETQIERRGYLLDVEVEHAASIAEKRIRALPRQPTGFHRLSPPREFISRLVSRALGDEQFERGMPDQTLASLAQALANDDVCINDQTHRAPAS